VNVPSIFTDKNVLITGGTGSFGRAFVAEALRHEAPRRLVIYSRDEMKQYEMAQQFSQERFPCLRYFIGDIRDADRLEMAMRGIDYVIHAAALKHVPAAEYNPIECIRTNIYGAENVVTAALRCRVRRVIALSTDKAASPINLYGASKLASDKIMIAANNLAGDIGTRFSVVRYGNVLGSRGSVVPLFMDLVRAGAKELPITDQRMSRFWITLKGGVAFVMTCLDQMQGGEIFVPKIPSMRMTDLAEALGPGLGHRIVGIRPGEKLHEVMVTKDDARMTIELPDYYVIQPAFSFWRGAKALYPNAKPLPEDFEYASNTNLQWLNSRSLRELLALEGTGVAKSA
jgi:UDP-N-acetylglucosamine 4,6-dehydratase/5-epimerase